MKDSRLFKKLVVFVGSLLFSLSILSIFVSYAVFKNIYIKILVNDLKNDISLYSKDVIVFLKNRDYQSLDREVKLLGKDTGLRITVILPDGKVVADSNYEPSKMENHKNRPEVIDSLSKGFGYSIRLSHTLNKKLLYAASPLISNGRIIGFLRISTFLTEVETTLKRFSNTIVAISLTLFLLSVFILFFYFKKVFSPLEGLMGAITEVKNGNLNVEISINSDDEFAYISRGFNEMVSELRRDISLIEKEKVKLETLMNALTEAVVLVEGDGRITFFNKKFADLFSLNNLSNRFLWEVVRDNDFIDFVEKVLKDNFKERFKLTHNGSVFEVSVIDIESTGEKLFIFYDLTEKIRLRKVKKDFVVNATHELKTPITIVKGFIETMRNDGVDSPYLPLIESNVERMVRLIDDMLLLSNLEDTHEKKLEKKRENICEIIETVITLFRKKAANKDIELRFLCEEGLTYEVDRFSFEQLLINLIDNAIRYTERGFVEVNAKVKDGRLFVSVKDTGIGIPSDKIDRVFERFYVVDKSRSKKTGGTGLGLSIVKHIVEMYSGEIRVKSEPNRGTVFEIYLP